MPPAARTLLARFRGSAPRLTGELNVGGPPRAVGACAELLPRVTFLERPEAGHCPWAGDPGFFAAATASLLV
ncbi:hypothetical protein [Streptomyces sp. M54]|uniref:hypothetical protein n=1 Tax=Streptomyces sp. M54 TaxID=2759525 RepID=UPI001A8EDAD3|nr:hypothetical protein [Streptomyces sp. M54]QSS89253.1 hypothetical protein H3V39_01565 [Streptomyces sp. M54]